MLTLRAGAASLVLAPEIGGSIVGWMLGRLHIMRRAAPETIIAGNARGLASFPLVPYSNRIAHGRFDFGGTRHQIALNFGDHPHAIHGIGWQSVWSVDAVGPGTARLSLTHRPDGVARARWPFAFHATQDFALTEDTLTVSLAIENNETDPAPAGLGLHPFFPTAHAPTLHFNAGSVWTNGTDHLPAERIAVPEAWDHTAGRRVGTATLDSCFAGWRRRADIAWAPPGPILSIEASEIFTHLIVFTPPGADFFCVEPVSHMTDALNRTGSVPDHGMHTLAPGETLAGTVRFHILDV